MHSLKPLEPGLMFWAGRDALDDVRSTGVRCGQLGLPGGMALTGEAAAQWKQALDAARFTLVTVFAAYDGESYADIPTVQQTVGFIPRSTREQRERRTYEVSDFAAKLGVASIACHIGFVPEDAADADYVAVRDLVRRICDHAAVHGQTFALETGQERADVLLRFLADCARPNLGINFDPANLILYGTGEPIEALRTLAPHVLSVHAKDGDWPPRDVPGALGTERALGQGSVGIERFVRTLAEAGFRGPLNVEREGAAPGGWLQDVSEAVKLLRSLTTEAPRPIPIGYHSIQPYLMLKNCANALAFYAQAFGAQEKMRMPGADGRIMHAEMQIGDSVVMMADEAPQMDAFSVEHYGGSPVSLLIYTENCDAMYAQALAAGAKSLREPADQPYGDRMAGVQDPFGYKWWLATSLQVA